MAEWLASIGLSRYVEVFANNRLDLDVIADLTETDLAAMGVALGDRKRLIRAIATLRGGPSPAADPIDPLPLPPTSRESWRRHLTVLFCDLVGSTPLSQQLDPEDLEQVIHEFQSVCTATITRHAGYVARFMGDGLLAYFGYPQAHEDDAERATRAGLEISERVRSLRTPDGEQLHVRVGIATGLVVVAGEAIGSGEAREQSVVGKTPNLAARLQSLADPDSVLIADSTHELLGRAMFVCKDLGPHPIRGLDAAVRIWRVLEERRNTSRFDAARAGNLTPLVGRGLELDRLLDLWRETRAGTGRFAWISGEAGIGKSRLCRALLDEAKRDAHHLIRFQCSPHYAQSPLQPVIDHLEDAARLERGDPIELKLDKLARLLDPSGVDHGGCMPFLAALLSIPTAGRYPLPELRPTAMRARTIEALCQHLLSLAAAKPLLLVVEDLHWVDPSTLELLGRCLQAAREAPVLAVLTSRPDFALPWPEDVHLHRLKLARLGDADVEALIARVTVGRSLPANVTQQIVDRTDGVPLFVEELTRSVIESGVLQEAGERYVLTGPLPTLAIPSTLQETLMARLDRLASVREVAQVAAALGRTFSFRLLSKAIQLPEDQLAAMLSQLSFADLIHATGQPPDSQYAFKHALLQSAAYETLLRAKRLSLHAHIADVLQQHFGDVAATQPELVAHHLTEAQLSAKAIEWWKRAGQRNVEASANAEAVVHFRRCLSLIENLNEDERRDGEELEVRIALGVPLMGTSGYTSSEFHANTDRALEICERHNDSEKVYPVLWGQVARSFSSGDVNSARVLARRFLDSADRQDNRQLRMIGHRLCGMTLFGAGELQTARDHLMHALNLHQAEADAPLTYVYGADQRVAALAYLGRTLVLLGEQQEGLRTAEQALCEARRIEHANTILYAEGCLLELHMMRRDVTALRAKVADVERRAREHGARNYQLVALAADQISRLADAGDAADQARLARIDGVLRELLDLNWVYWVTRLALLAAEAGASMGHATWARGWYMQARQHVESLGQGVCLPELHQVHAALLAAEGAGQVEVASAFSRAIAIGRAQGARWCEDRAAARLAALAPSGHPPAAYSLL